MLIGIARKEITPSEPSYLSGQIARTQKHTGILDPIFVSALYFENDSGPLCFLSFDLLMLERKLSEKIRESVASCLDMKIERIFTSCTHTHAGPEILEEGLFGIKGKTQVNLDYLEFLNDASIAAVTEARNQKTESFARYYVHMIDGYYGNRNGFDLPSDKSLHLIEFQNTEHRPIAVFLNLSCHDTVLGAENTFISADLHGALRNGLEERFKCPVFPTNGAEGDVSNRLYREGNDVHELKRMAQGILNQLPVDIPWTPMNLESFKLTQIRYPIHFETKKDRIEKEIDQSIGLIKRETNPDQRRVLIAGLEILEHFISQPQDEWIELSSTLIDFPDVTFVTIPGELFSELGIRLKQMLPKTTIILGLTNSGDGYLINHELYGQNYESMTTGIQAGEPERFIDKIIESYFQMPTD